MEKLNKKSDGSSLAIVQDNIDTLKTLFPDIFSEGKIDFDKLRETLGDTVETREERYNFTWHGKSQARRIAQTPSTGTLRPCKEESKHWDSTENLFIEGDNLEVLKLMQKSYHKQVKMIYIDPPYNTGKEFIYPDNYQDNLDTYLEYTGQKDSEGRKFGTKTENTGRYHTNWLNMMYPRLKLARNLLRDDGVIFISIDDNEVANLRKLCDEIFGEENFVAQLTWEKKKKGAFLSGAITNVKEYIVIYTKKISSFQGLIGEIARNKETYPVIKTTNTRGERIIKKGIPSKFRENNHVVKAGTRISSGNMEMILLSDLVIRNNVLVEDVRVDSNWIYSQELIDKYSDDRSLYITQDLYFRRVVSEPRQKMLKDLLSMKSNSAAGFDFVYSDDLFSDGWGTNEDGFDELHNLLGAQSVMSFPKPSKLISKLILSACRFDSECIVLDFFSGSSTTAHSLLSLNVQDDGNRKYIMVQLPEVCDEKSEAYKAGYKTIADIGKERIRRSGEKILQDNADKNVIENLDIGFKVFKLDSSNIEPWDGDFDNLESALHNTVNNIKKDRSEDDVLYEILLKYGLDLTVPIEERQINGKTVYSIGLGALVVCLDDAITLDVVEGIGGLKKELAPEVMRVVFKDSGFKDDVVKTNAIQILKKYGIDDVKSL